ncbi:MAG: thioesterase domain-containing protein [Ramlibacter sp.]|nr:thioesterase domain-containing protein [Ramlibacter sp.]
MSRAHDLVSRSALGLPLPYEAPAPGSAEDRIATAFAQCLRIDQVGAVDCFFDLGGDSMSAVELQLIIHADMGLSFPVSLLAETSTPRELAAALAPGASAAAPQAQATGARPPIFAVHGKQGFMLPLKEFFDGLHPGQKFNMFELPGLRTKAARLRRIEDIAQAYCDELTAQYPSGPVYLAGFCIGCLIAIEMAIRFSAAGRPVARLVLVEPNLSEALADLYRDGLWDDAQACARHQDEGLRLRFERVYRTELLGQRERDRDRLAMRHPGHEFSIDARAKLMASYMVYKPQAVPVEAHVVMSTGRNRMLKVDTANPIYWDRIIPRRNVYMSGQTHDDLLHKASGATAALIQRIFDGTA